MRTTGQTGGFRRDGMTNAAAATTRPQRAEGRGHLAAKALGGRTRIPRTLPGGRCQDPVAGYVRRLDGSCDHQHGRRADRWRPDGLERRCRPRHAHRRDHPGLRKDLQGVSAGTAEVTTQISRSAPMRASTGCRRKPSCSTGPRCFAGSRSISTKAPSSWRSKPCCSAARRWARRWRRVCFAIAGASARTASSCHAEDLRLSGERVRLTPRIGGARRKVAFATLLYIGPRRKPISALRPLIDGHMGGASTWAGKLVVRLAAPMALLSEKS
jgi:urease accessory protein